MRLTNDEFVKKVSDALRNDGFTDEEQDIISFFSFQIAYFLLSSGMAMHRDRKYLARALESVAFMVRLQEAENEKENENVNLNSPKPN